MVLKRDSSAVKIIDFSNIRNDDSQGVFWLDFSQAKLEKNPTTYTPKACHSEVASRRGIPFLLIRKANINPYRSSDLKTSLIIKKQLFQPPFFFLQFVKCIFTVYHQKHVTPFVTNVF